MRGWCLWASVCAAVTYFVTVASGQAVTWRQADTTDNGQTPIMSSSKWKYGANKREPNS